MRKEKAINLNAEHEESFTESFFTWIDGHCVLVSFTYYESKSQVAHFLVQQVVVVAIATPWHLFNWISLPITTAVRFNPFYIII